MAEIPFPGGAADQDVFFHEDKVCVYHEAINTWECRTIETGTASGQPVAVTTRTVYTIPIPTDDGKVLPSPRDLPDLNTQYDVNWYLADQIVKKARPPIISASPPTNHPLYPTAELVEGDLWIDSLNELYYYKVDQDTDQGEWVKIRDLEDRDRPPIISETEPTEHPRFPGQPLEEGDFWIDNHEGRAFTALYYWTGTEWEELEHDENWDEELKKHTCAQFYKKVYDYNSVAAKEGHFCSAYNFGGDRDRVKWWTSPPGKGFYNNGDTIWVNDQGPYVLEELTESGQWTTFFLPGSIQPADGTIVKFSKIPKLCDTSFNDDRYVKKTGDTMTGALVMQDANIDFIIPGESLKDANGDPILENDGKGNMVEQWDDSIDRFSRIESLPPMILRSDGTYGSDTSAAFGIRVEIDDGNTYRNRFVVGNRNGDAVTVTGGTGPNVEFGTGFPGNQNPQTGDPLWEAGEEGGVKITGIPTPTKENPNSNLAVNKGYVDARDEELRQGIIELEEEIDAIAPSVERGKWRFTAVGTVANPGQFTMYDDAFGSGQPTGLFKSAKSIWFNAVDNDGVSHAFGDVDDGELLEIFIEGSPEYGLYEVVGQAHDETLGATSFWVIDVNFVRTNEDTTAVAPNEVCRFKVFMAPTGGDASSFVMKSGDQMTGELEFYQEQAGNSSNYNTPSGPNTKDIKFTTKNTDNNIVALAQLYQPGYSNTVMCSGNLGAKSSLYTSSYLYGLYYNSDGSAVAKNPRIYLSRSTNSSGNVTSEYGSLQWGSSDMIKWDSTNVTIPRISTNSREGFKIKGTQLSNYTAQSGTDGDLLSTYHNSGNSPDSVSYYGKVTDDNHIATKKYVDDNAGGKVDMTCSASGKTAGDFWYCFSDQTLYLRIS